MNIWNGSLFFVVAVNVIKVAEQVKVTKKDVLSLAEQMELPLRYCSMKSDSDKTYVYSNCFRKWNKKYDKFCKGSSSYSETNACKRLKKKMKNALQEFSTSRTKTLTERCTVGPNRDKAFDPAIQFCCENHIWKKKYREDKICCGKVHADRSTSRCCNSSYISLSRLTRAHCCDGKLISEEKGSCDASTAAVPVASKSFVTPKYREESYTGRNDTNYRETEQTHEKVYNHNHTNKIVYICTGLVLGMLLVVGIVVVIYKWRGYKEMSRSNNIELSRLNERNQSSSNFYGTITTPTATQLMHVTQTRSHNYWQSTLGIEQRQIVSPETNLSSSPCLDKKNKCPSDTVAIQTQTEPRKEINVKNSMGRDFSVQHIFTKSNRSLQIPDSAVKLTLSDVDLQNNSIKCYASTFRNLTENYAKLDKVMSKEEQIVSPAVEYFFPAVKRLKQFACIDMDIGRRGKDLHVWKVKSDQGKTKSTEREEIPLKKHIDVNDDTVDAYYEIVGGKIRIFLKSFSWLVCTVCGSNHYGFNLSARIYVKKEPHTPLSRQVRVTLYILDAVRQLDDYLKFINEDENSLKLFRKVNLPDYVSLEESISIRLLLMSETVNTWRQLYIDTGEVDESELVPVKNITQCHKYKSNGQPFSKDWHFESLPYSITSGKFTFQCMLKMTVIPQHQGVNMKVPPNKYIINEEVDFATVKKRHEQGGHIDIPGYPLNPVSQPASVVETASHSAEIIQHQQQHEYRQHHQNRRQQQGINQNTVPQLTTREMPNASATASISQRSLPRPGLLSTNYGAQGARPRTTNRNRESDNIPRSDRTVTVQPNTRPFHCLNLNCSNGALPCAYSEPNIRENIESTIEETGDVRGEFSRSIN